MRLIWYVLRPFPVQWVTLCPGLRTTTLCEDAALQSSFWRVCGDEGKNTISWEVFLFPLLTNAATKCIMNLYKPSKFNTRTEDTEISLRNLTFTQMEDIIPSLCTSHHQTHRLGDGWQGDTHHHQHPAFWCLPEESCWRSEHSFTRWHSTESELGETCYLWKCKRYQTYATAAQKLGIGFIPSR